MIPIRYSFDGQGVIFAGDRAIARDREDNPTSGEDLAELVRRANAAPKLLEALKKAETIMQVDRDRAERKGREDTIGASVLALLRSTIAEAEGRS